MTTLLFFGDIVGDAGLAFVEAHLPALRQQFAPDFIIANGENMALSFQPGTLGNCGLSFAGITRLFDSGVDVITGGNHSWDSADTAVVHENLRVIRPLNYGTVAPGNGAVIIEKNGVRLGVMNIVSRTALAHADYPLAAFEAQYAAWANQVDLILVDFHGESIMEKMTFAFAVAGRVTAVIGTHTHVPTLDTRLLPGGTAYVTDAGMTGPSGGLQGYLPEYFVQSMQQRLPGKAPFALATGAVEAGIIVIRCEDGLATHIERVVLA